MMTETMATAGIGMSGSSISIIGGRGMEKGMLARRKPNQTISTQWPKRPTMRGSAEDAYLTVWSDYRLCICFMHESYGMTTERW
jgi:hypothetical protein